MTVGVIRGVVNLGGDGLKRLEPNTSESFDAFVSNLVKRNKFDFGSAKTMAIGITPVRNATDLAVYFDPYAQTADDVVINKEWQYYPDNFTNTNFNFATDALELTARLDSGVLPAGVTTASPTADVAYSRQVTVADASALKVGQVVGLGAEAYDNLHRMHTYSITTPANGDVITLLLTHALTAAQGGFDPVTLTVTSAGVAADDAASFVSQVNAHATLQAWNITALLMPGVPGGFLTSFPKYSLAASDDYGAAGKGSVTWLTRTFSRVGTATLLTPQNVSGVNYIVSKSVNTLTLSHPVTLTTASVLTFNPVYMMEVRFTGTLGGVDRITNGDFSVDASWTKGAGWSIAAGVASASTSSAALSQTIASLVQGLSYTITYTVTRSAGSIRPSIGGTNGTSRSAAGTYTESITAGAGGVLAFTGTGFTGTIDNVSIKAAGSYILQDVSFLSAGMVVQCSFQDSNIRRILNVDSTNKEISVDGAPYMQSGHWLTAYPVFMAKTNAVTTANTVLNFAAVPSGVAIGHRYFNYFATGQVGDIFVAGVTATTVTLDTAVTVGNGDTIQFSPPISSGQFWSKAIFAPGLDGINTVAVDLKFDAPGAEVVGAWPAFWTYTATDDPNPTAGGSGTSEIDFFDVFNYWNNTSANNYIPAGGSTQTGTMRAGSTSTTAVLATTSTQRTGDYVGMTLQITSGTGNAQTRTITGYDGTTQIATVSPEWTVTPDATSVYKFNAVDFYTHPKFTGGSLPGNNFGAFPRRASAVYTATKAFFYLDNLLVRAAYVTWNKYKRGQIGVNLAVGSASTSFNSNGFYPVDASQFPMKYRVEEMSWWSSP